MSAGDDEADVERILAGDISAFEGIVRRWQGPLINSAYRFCRDRGRAEDMAQIAFLRAYRALPKWRREAAFSTWLFALAMNVYRSELRRIPARTLSLDDVATRRAEPDDAENESLKRAVRSAVQTLSAKYRDALILFYFREMDITAVARDLGVPDGTVKARLFRGREILRSKLAKLRSVNEGR